MGTTTINLKDRNGQNITFELDDDIPFEPLEQAMDESIDYTTMLSGTLRCSPQRWQKVITAASVITPEEYKNNWGEIARLPTSQVKLLLSEINRMYPLVDFISLRLGSITDVRAMEMMMGALNSAIKQKRTSPSSTRTKSQRQTNKG